MPRQPAKEGAGSQRAQLLKVPARKGVLWSQMVMEALAQRQLAKR